MAKYLPWWEGKQHGPWQPPPHTVPLDKRGEKAIRAFGGPANNALRVTQWWLACGRGDCFAAHLPSCRPHTLFLPPALSAKAQPRLDNVKPSKGKHQQIFLQGLCCLFMAFDSWGWAILASSPHNAQEWDSKGLSCEVGERQTASGGCFVKLYLEIFLIYSLYIYIYIYTHITTNVFAK